jgi:hypothetical protein
MRIVPSCFEQTRGQAQRHRRVVRPFTWLEVERSPTDHVRDGLEAAARPELCSCPDGVADGQAEKAASESI